MTQSGGNYDEEDWESFAFPTYNGNTDMTGYDMQWGYILFDYPGYYLTFRYRCGESDFYECCNGHYNYYTDGLMSGVHVQHNGGEGFYDQEDSFFGACIEENSLCMSFILFYDTDFEGYIQLWSVWLNDETELSATHPDTFGNWNADGGFQYNYEGVSAEAGVYSEYDYYARYNGYAYWVVWTPEYYASSGITEVGDTINVWTWADRYESQDNVSDTVTRSNWVFAEVIEEPEEPEEPDGTTNQAIVSGAGLALGIFLGATALL